MWRTFGVAVTVFGCGWILMGLEIVGGRMLAPYFGAGIEVWGSVIGIFLAALSLGYFLGGLLSQRFSHLFGLAGVVVLAAVSLVPVSLWYAPVSDWLAAFELHERWGSLLAAGALFLVPSLLLGMVSPFAVRLVARSVEEAGKHAGMLYATSTVGSFLGCLVTAFYLIPWMGIRKILFLSTASLLLLAVGLLLVGHATCQCAAKGEP